MGLLDAPHQEGFSADEVTAVIKRYPRLVLGHPYVLEGTFDLHASYDGQVITDEFLIRIAASPEYPARLPAMREIGGRTAMIAAKYRLADLQDLHRSSDGAACLCVKQMEKKQFPPGSDLSVFVENLVVPYLYGLSSYDANGRWPWEEHSHGALGLLEFFAEDHACQTKQQIKEVAALIRRTSNWKEYHKQIRRPSADRSCLCGSTRRFKDCHRRAWEGALRLNTELKRLRIKEFR